MQIKLKALSFRYGVFILVMFNLLILKDLLASDFGDISIKTKGCLSNIKSLPHYSSLPKLNEADIAKWKNQESDTVTPEHDFTLVRQDDVFKHIRVTFYFARKSRKGFVEVKAGIADISDWYGSFYLEDEIIACLDLLQGGVE